MSEHHCPYCPHPDLISSASIHRSMEDAARARRIREAERAVIAAAEKRFREYRCNCSDCWKMEQEALSSAVDALREARKGTP